jgi:hypothetical protein
MQGHTMCSNFSGPEGLSCNGVKEANGIPTTVIETTIHRDSGPTASRPTRGGQIIAPFEYISPQWVIVA